MQLSDYNEIVQKELNNHGTDNLDFDYEVYGPGNTDASDVHQTIAVELAFFLKSTIWKSETGAEDMTIESNSAD